MRKAFRVIMLAGGSIYLVAMSLAMFNVAIFGPTVWHPDFLLQHGEPYLVGFIGIWSGIEAFIMAKELK